MPCFPSSLVGASVRRAMRRITSLIEKKRDKHSTVVVGTMYFLVYDIVIRSIISARAGVH